MCKKLKLQNILWNLINNYLNIKIGVKKTWKLKHIHHYFFKLRDFQTKNFLANTQFVLKNFINKLF